MVDKHIKGGFAYSHPSGIMNSPFSFKHRAFSLPKDGTQSEDQTAFRLFEGEALAFAAIADGVGSSSSPLLAATTVIESCLELLTIRPRTSVQEVFKNARHALELAASSTEGVPSLKTTLTACLIANDTVHVGHVGDSRIYHLRSNGIITRTKDQTEVQYLIDEGILSKERARSYPRRHVLLSALSSGSEYELFETSFTIKRSDRLLLLTDGMYNVITKKELSDISSTMPSFDDFACSIRNAVEARYRDDDATCLIIEVD